MRHTISSFRHSLFTLCSHPVHLRRPRYLRMNVSRSIALAVLLALTTPALASVQPFDIAQGGPAARQISFADVAAAVVQSNFQLRAAALNVAIAQAQLAQAQGGQMPQATLSGSYTRTQEPPPAFLLNPNIYAAGVAISYPLSTGGRVEAQIALAQANLRGAQASFNRTKQQLVHSAEQIYLQGLLASESVAAARRALDAASESLRVARVRFSSGAAAQFDVLQAEVAIANAEQTLVQAQTGVANAAAGLGGVA
ncbi:MAG: TolC family protein [Bacillati bacterium ANGP1]|uniref:TolC family protein n=1 Tax=Candidatus Segetimicrobium genomatis TaxID=2569760 RepID=A0A537KT49_9BACT|nr:MAG: TolC family protein [Terrabacteria group bacterium ANGP1]